MLMIMTLSERRLCLETSGHYRNSHLHLKCRWYTQTHTHAVLCVCCSPQTESLAGSIYFFRLPPKSLVTSLNSSCTEPVFQRQFLFWFSSQYRYTHDAFSFNIFLSLGTIQAGWFSDFMTSNNVVHCTAKVLSWFLFACKRKMFEITQSQCATKRKIHRIEIHLESWKWKHCSGMALARCQMPLSIDFSLLLERNFYYIFPNIYQLYI